MALDNTASREVFEGENTIIRNLTASNPELESFTAVGYSSDFGGQVTSEIKAHATIDGNDDLNITVDKDSAPAGSDFIFEYELKNGDTGKFFYQNGVHPANADLFRSSAALERLSAVYDTDGEAAGNPTDFTDFSRFANSNLQYRQSGNKHDGEPIPRFSNGTELNFPDGSDFSSRQSTVVLVIDWPRDEDKTFPVATLRQGGNIYLRVLNDQGSVRVESDFAGSVVQTSEAEGKVIVDLEITDEEVQSSVNRGEQATTKLQGRFSGGTPTLDLTADTELFDILTYGEPLSTGKLDRVAKQLSYFYAIDLTSNGIQNHLFYDPQINQFDMLYAATNVRATKLDTTAFSSQPAEWNFVSGALAVANDSRGNVVVGTDRGSEVHRLGPGGNPIWTFDGHDGPVQAVEAGSETASYSGSEDQTVKKIGKRGTPIWNFGGHDSPVVDLAVYEDVAVYSATEGGTVRRITATRGEEDTTGNWPYDSNIQLEFTAVAADLDENIYVGATNGELRVLDDEGSEVTCFEPLGGDEIVDLAIGREGVYVASKKSVKLLEGERNAWLAGNVGKWTTDFSGDPITAVAISPEGTAAVSQGTKIFTLDGQGNITDNFDLGSAVNDLSFQPGTFQPHWK